MQNKIEIVPELFDYALRVANNYSCKDVRKWLQEKKYNIDEFLAALTFVKTGILDDQCYQEIEREFLKKSKDELHRNWSAHFQPNPEEYKRISSILLGKPYEKEINDNTYSCVSVNY